VHKLKIYRISAVTTLPPFSTPGLTRQDSPTRVLHGQSSSLIESAQWLPENCTDFSPSSIEPCFLQSRGNLRAHQSGIHT